MKKKIGFNKTSDLLRLPVVFEMVCEGELSFNK